MPVDVQAAMADDNRYVDATETVSITEPGSTSATSVPYCRRTNRQVSHETAGGGIAVVTVTTFYVWKNDYATKPKLNARIVDSGSVAYRVADSSDTTMRTRWDVECVKEVS